MIDYKNIIREFYERVYNQRDIKAIDEWVSPDVIGHGPALADEIRGIQKVKEFSLYAWKTYTDYKLTIKDIFAEENKVVLRAEVQAKHIPTDKKVHFMGLNIYRFENDKIVEYWRVYDRLDLYEKQLGGWKPN